MLSKPTTVVGAQNLTSPRQEMIDEFNARIRVTEGKKYIKVIQGTSVWGFIVKEDGGKFRKGDILKSRRLECTSNEFCPW
jgi:hypothetical protein